MSKASVRSSASSSSRGSSPKGSADGSGAGTGSQQTHPAMALLQRVVHYSPLAFASAELEAAYLHFQGHDVACSALAVMGVALMAWTVQALHVITHGATFPRLAALFFTLIALLLARTQHTSPNNGYAKRWVACHLCVHVSRALAYAAGQPVVLRGAGMTYSVAALAAPRGAVAQATVAAINRGPIGWVLAANNSLLVSPLLALVIHLPLVMRAMVKVVFLVIAVSGNAARCTAGAAGAGLTSVQGDGRPWALLNPSRPAHMLAGVVPLMPAMPSPYHSLGCTGHLAFWQIQAAVLAVMMTVARDVVSRRRFLAANSALLGPDGPARAAAWPLGNARSVHTCINIAFALLLCDALLVFSPLL